MLQENCHTCAVQNFEQPKTKYRSNQCQHGNLVLKKSLPCLHSNICTCRCRLVLLQHMVAIDRHSIVVLLECCCSN